MHLVSIQRQNMLQHQLITLGAGEGGEDDKEVEKCAGRAEGGAEVTRSRELEGGGGIKGKMICLEVNSRKESVKLTF